MILSNVNNFKNIFKVYFWMVIIPSLFGVLIVLCQLNNPFTIIIAAYVIAYTINVWAKAVLEVKRAKKNTDNLKNNI